MGLKSMSPPHDSADHECVQGKLIARACGTFCEVIAIKRVSEKGISFQPVAWVCTGGPYGTWVMDLLHMGEILMSDGSAAKYSAEP